MVVAYGSGHGGGVEGGVFGLGKEKKEGRGVDLGFDPRLDLGCLLVKGGVNWAFGLDGLLGLFCILDLVGLSKYYKGHICKFRIMRDQICQIQTSSKGHSCQYLIIQGSLMLNGPQK